MWLFLSTTNNQGFAPNLCLSSGPIMDNSKNTIQAGCFNEMTVMRFNQVGAFLDDGDKGLLLPKRFVPREAKVGDKLRVFVYHDSEDRLIATTQEPLAVLGDIAYLQVVSNTPHGSFLDWGLMKDLFVPKSKQNTLMRVGAFYLVKLYLDEQTGRIAASEKIEQFLNNDELTVKEKDKVSLQVYRKTQIGYSVIINKIHLGLLHFSEIFRELNVGDIFDGYIKTIRPDNKIDVGAGIQGYKKVEDEATKILRLLDENFGYLPYHDKSTPEEIYEFFGMSKKTFKMTTGRLYKERKIELTKTGIKKIEKE